MTAHSSRTSAEVMPLSRSALSLITAVTSSRSSEPPLTPIRIALPWSRARVQMALKLAS